MIEIRRIWVCIKDLQINVFSDWKIFLSDTSLSYTPHFFTKNLNDFAMLTFMWMSMDIHGQQRRCRITIIAHASNFHTSYYIRSPKGCQATCTAYVTRL